MKKQLRILLSVTLAITLLISTISGVFAVAPKGPNGADLHWVGYNAGMAYYGDAQQVNTNFKFETDTANLYTGSGADSDGKALKVTAPVFQVFGAVLSLKADTYYQLSFQYKAPSVYNGAVFSNTGVIVSGGNWNGDGSDYLGNVERDKAFYNNDSGKKVSLTTELLANKAANTWYKTTISFYTGSKTTAYLTMRPLVDTVYLDAFDLTEVSTLPGGVGYISDWKVYDNTTTKIGTGGQLTYSNAPVVEDTTTVYIGEGADADGKSMKVTNGYAQYVTASVTVAKNKSYALTGYYKTDTLNGSNAVFSHAIVIKDGGAKFDDSISYMDASTAYYLNATNKKITLDGTTTVSGVSKDAWNKITLYFHSGDLEQVLVSFRPTNNPNTTVYFDGLTLTEVTNLPNDAVVVSEWKVYDNSTSKFGTGGQLTYSNAPVVEDTTTVYTGEGADADGKSVKVTNGYAQYVTGKVSVEKNKCYALTGYYKTDTLNGSNGVFSHAIVVKDGGAKFDDSISYMDASTAYFLNAAKKKITLDGTTTVSGVSKDAWNKITLYFYSGDLEQVLVSFRPTNNPNTTVYFDGFSLNEISTLPGDVGVVSGWKVYDNTTSKFGTGGQLTYSNAPVVEDTTTVYTGEGADADGKSIKVTNGYAQYVTGKVSVEKNKRYAFTAHYKTDTLNSSNGVFSHAIVIKDGGAKFGDSISYMDAGSAYYVNTANSNVNLSDTNTLKGVSKDAWNKITLYFYSGDLEQVLVSFRPTNNPNTTVYFDGFALTEVTELPGENVGPDISDGWVVYDFTTQKIGTGGKLRTTANVTATTEQVYTGTDGDGDGKALKFNTDCYAQYVTKKMEFKANTYYEVTAYYYTTAVTANAVFSHVRMVKDGGTNADITPDNMGQIARDSDAYYYNKNGAKYTLTGERTTGAKPNQWNKVTLKFYSGSNTSGMLTFRPTVNTTTATYVDNIKLTEVSALPGADFVDTGWTIYDNTTTKLGAGGAIRSGASTNYDTSIVYTGAGADTDGKSFSFSGAYAQYLTKKFTFEANNYYVLTAYYYGTELDGAKGMLSHARVTKDGALKAELSVDNLGAIDRSRAYYTNKNGVHVNVDGNTVTDVKANQWNKLTISFYSGSLTEALMVFRPTINGTFYIDGISLAKVSAFAGADRMPTGWTTYTMESEKIGSGGALHTRAAVDFSTEKVYTGAGADTDGKSFVFDNECFAQYVTKKLELKKNTYYNLTYYYYGSVLGGNDAILGETFIVKDGAKISVDTASTDNLGFLSRSTAYYTNKHGLTISKYDAKLLSNSTAETWNKVEIPFYSGDLTSALLAIRPVAPAANNGATGSPVYIDGIALTEANEKDFDFYDMKPFTGWNGPQSEYVINFDDFYVPMDMTDRVQLADAPKKDGKVTTAAHILPGAWPSATVPNISAIGADKDPVFTLPVEENTKYSIKYSLFITEGQPVLRYFAFYYDFFYTHTGNEDTTTLVRNSGMSERGEWVTFETFFTTKPGQSVCSLAWNAGEFTVDMYIDDIVLRKVQPGAIADAADTSYCENFYNDLIDLGILDDIAAAKSGVYKIPVNKGVSYILGLSAQRAAGSNSRIFVSFDGVNPINPGMKGAINGELQLDTKMKRYGLDFMTDDSGYIYLVIENKDGTLKIKDPALFFAYNNHKNDNKGTPTDPNATFVTHSGAYKELWVPGSNDDSFAGQMSGDAVTIPDSGSPETGSAPIWPITAIAVTLVMICALCIVLRKGGERA